MTQVLVTGASGFIGNHLVRLLAERGHQVSCLLRPSSNRDGLEAFHPNVCVGDVTDLDSLRRAMIGVDVVFHLAGLTKSLHSQDLMRVNELGTRNVSLACSEMTQPPVLVIASSLAAAGPSGTNRPRRESDLPAPVSTYGKSKFAGELAARAFASHVPTTIVRPPIVFGQGDKDGFNLFQSISRFGIHLVPGFRNNQFSAIHARDLAHALTLAAVSGQRLSLNAETKGIYFAADEQIISYAEFGRMIGRCLGRPHALVVHAPVPAVWTVSAVNELFSQIRRRPHILNLDKAREATAGSWACSPERLHQDTGFRCERSLEDRVNETVDWYVRQGWLQRRMRPQKASSLSAPRGDSTTKASPTQHPR